ncbi:MAG: heavy-metal-associated domain-containing protein [Bacteroidota bacterium]
MKQSAFYIQNLKCGGCAHTVTSKLSSIDSLTDIQVDVESSKVSFSYQKEEDLLQAKAVLKSAGYPVLGENNSFTTQAKSFVSCATGKMKSN